MKYSAFIAYKQETDAKYAEAIQAALQQFAKPWNKVRAINVCRDESDFGASSNLPKSIQQSLKESEFLIVIASPGAVASRWVPMEIAFWLENKSASTILLVHTGGQIKWNESKRDFDWEHTTALPKVLQNVFDGMPYITSLTGLNPTNELSLKSQNHAFKDKIAGLASTIRGGYLKGTYTARTWRSTERRRFSKGWAWP